MRKLDIIIGILLALLTHQAYAENGTPPDEVESQISETDTSFVGARILKQGDEVWGGAAHIGPYEDEGTDGYAFWQGDTLFFGGDNPLTGNTIDGVAEFYWFESSIPKSADFYVMVLKVKSSPNIIADWQLAQEDGWLGEFLYNILPAQYVDVVMKNNGDAGALRWDWSVPFQNYKWEPVKTINISQSYSAGYDTTVSGQGDAGVGWKGEFKEAGVLADASAGVAIQSKGYVNEQYKVSSQYSVTLYKWEMVVLGGADQMTWNLIITKDGSTANDSAYHEYFVVMQAPQGEQVWLEDIHIGASFRNPNILWFDGWDHISVSIGDIVVNPPIDIECYEGDLPPKETCEGEGVCADTLPICAKGKWACIPPETKEDLEVSCDGLDNDCDGLIDEDLFDSCSSPCGKGLSQCVLGTWLECDAPQPLDEVCNGLDDDCDGLVDNSPECYPEVPDIWFEPEPEPEPIEEEVVEKEWDWSAFDEVEEEKEDAPDPAEPVEVNWSSTWADVQQPQEEPEGEVVYTVEAADASGCNTESGKSGIGFALIFLLVYAFGAVMGYNARKRRYEKEENNS